jgi:crossover junction endodeoxyribonuclease RuvC
VSAKIILGVDPALGRTGWALLSIPADSSFTIAGLGTIAPKGKSRGEKLTSVSSQFGRVLAEWKPDEAHFELPGKWMHRHTSRNAVEAMGMARGVMLMACAEMGVPAFEADFHTIRREMLGGWKAGKSAAATYLATLGIRLPERPRGGIDTDIADAILVALHAAKCKTGLRTFSDTT